MKDGEGEKEKMTTSNDIHIGGHMIEGCQVSQGPGRKAVVVVRMEGEIGRASCRERVCSTV